jgi:glycosyltransferase involved in cell wall biosynthesis
MAEAPALSNVVPVYNGAATVGELVQALRGLAIEGGLEIVLVVDYSPDNSLDVCKTLAVRSLERRRVSGPGSEAVRSGMAQSQVSPGRAATSRASASSPSD